ncbi:MAG: IS200/IS605 family transposase [Pyrinomonadaceae bacterium]|nr:IS200/IS605 family transposase [Pyrinomonadaceae bacterium]
MPSTLTSLNFHVVFSTKERRPLIKPAFKDDLFAYTGGIIRDLGAVPLAVGGIEDHIHLLLGLRSWHRPDYVIRDIKSGSTKWVTNEKKSIFKWQRGYAAFSVSPTRIEKVRKYILNQEEHHKGVSFEEELITLLDEAGVEYDPKYLL